MRELRRFEAALRGKPDELLTAYMLAAAGVLVLIALRGPVALKALVLAWVLFP